MNINQRVGDRIKKARLVKKWSREQLARRMDCTQQTVEKYEKGVVNISVRRLAQISNALGISITYFLQDDILLEHFKKILLPKS
jgi:transcriptional regulator with XRE-family HTH domain